MARIKNIHLARQHYEDVDLAVKELGTLWVLDKINAGLQYGRRRAEEMREKRSSKGNTAQGDDNV